MRASALLALIILLGACAPLSRPTMVYEESNPNRAALMEATLRLAIEDSQKSALPYEVAFIKIGDDQDPSPELLGRLSDISDKLKPYSACQKESVPHIPWEFRYCERADRNCKKRGIVIDASIIKVINESTARVSFGWRQHSSAAAGVEALLKKVNGEWKLSKVESRLMS
jgi:hypothetical protein